LQISTSTNSKIGRKKSQRMKLQRRRSSLEFSKRLTGFVRSKRPSPEGRQRLSEPKQGGSTLTEKEQDRKSFGRQLIFFASRNRGKGLRFIKHTANPTLTHSHLHLHVNVISTPSATNL
jgi:hypothetical protein